MSNAGAMAGDNSWRYARSRRASILALTWLSLLAPPAIDARTELPLFITRSPLREFCASKNIWFSAYRRSRRPRSSRTPTPTPTSRDGATTTPAQVMISRSAGWRFCCIVLAKSATARGSRIELRELEFDALPCLTYGCLADEDEADEDGGREPPKPGSA